MVYVLIIDSFSEGSSISPDAEKLVNVIDVLFSTATVQLLPWGDLSATSLQLALRDMRGSSSALSFLYFTGHGHSDEIDSYLVMPGSEPGAEGYPLSMLVKQMPRGHDQKWIAFLDCCHVDLSQFQWARGQLNIAGALQQSGSNRAVMAAAGPEEEAALLAEGGSPFTAALCEGMLGSAANRSGEVTLGNLHDYVSARLEGQNLPPASLSGDLSSSFRILEGLAPGTFDREEQPDTVALDAERFAASVHGRIATSGEDWASSGWQDAVRGLEPVVRWFDKQSRRSDVSSLPLFTRARSIVDRHHRYVATVSRGIDTGHGVVTRLLGQGGFGSVWTLSEGDEEIRAIKVYSPDEIHNRAKVARFERGYRAMNQLDHPGIVSVSAYLQTPAAIVMELVPGADISAWNPFEEFEDALDFIYETAKSLSYAHGVSVIHRDLKPANILAVADGEKYRPVITDFDLAWFSTATKITKEAMGYAFYAAPEQIQSPNHPATREPTVDVYSLMQVFFYLVVGQDPKPFDLQDNVQRLKRTLESTLKGDGHVDSVVRAYLAGSALSPRQRTSDMQALLKDLREVKESTYAEPVDVEATFVDFCQRAAIQAGWTQIHLANSTKITASSPSTRSTFEIIHEARPNRIIVRVKTFDLANATNVRRKDFFSVHQARVTAGLSADGDAIKVPLGGGLFVVQFAYEYGRLTSREAESFAARVRKVYSAMERTK